MLRHLASLRALGTWLAVAALLLTVPCVSGAHPFLNERPLFSYDMTLVQAVLDDVAGVGVLDAVTDQSPYAVFTAGEFTATLAFESVGVDEGEGIYYDWYFYGATTYLDGLGGLFSQNPDPEFPPVTDVDTGAVANLDANGQVFGLGLRMVDLCCGDDEFVFSQDFFPGYNDLAMLIFELGPEDFLFLARIDASYGPSWGVRLEGVTPVVPEPSTGLLLGLGLLGLAVRSRSRAC